MQGSPPQKHFDKRKPEVFPEILFNNRLIFIIFGAIFHKERAAVVT
jgi:hypothetical protein